jgi:hypothetical protein
MIRLHGETMLGRKATVDVDHGARILLICNETGVKLAIQLDDANWQLLRAEVCS